MLYILYCGIINRITGCPNIFPEVTKSELKCTHTVKPDIKYDGGQYFTVFAKFFAVASLQITGVLVTKIAK